MHLGLTIYGSLDTLSGGYLYDRMLVLALERRGHSVEVLSLPNYDYAKNLSINFNTPWLHRMARAKVDLMIQDELNHPSLFLANRLLGKRRTYPLLSLVHHLRTSETHPPASQRIYRFVERAYLRSVDGFIANSHTTLASIDALAHPDKPSLIAYPAGDHLPGTRITPHELARRTAKSQPLRILFVGNVVPRKATHVLVDALAHVDRSLWRLTIVGNADADPAYTRRILARVDDLGIAAQVEWRGRLPDAQLVATYREHHLLAMPSYEGFGIVYLEAMRYGLPVIASTAGAARELVMHGANGFLVTPEDARSIARYIGLLATNDAQLATMSFAALDRYQKHPTWSESMQAVVAWLEQRWAWQPTHHPA